MVLPTDAPVLEQVEANHRRVGELIETAGQAGANIVCLQEAWTMPYGLCTRERLPWTQFAENPETGASVTFLAKLAAKHQMVIVSPILERVGQNIFVSIPISFQPKILHLIFDKVKCGTNPAIQLLKDLRRTKITGISCGTQQLLLITRDG